MHVIKIAGPQAHLNTNIHNQRGCFTGAEPEGIPYSIIWFTGAGQAPGHIFKCYKKQTAIHFLTTLVPDMQAGTSIRYTTIRAGSTPSRETT